MRAITLLTAALLAATALNAAEVYRSVDADGNVSYSDRPVDANARTVTIATPRPSTPPTPIGRSAEPADGVSGETGDDVQREPREPTPEERAADRAANCTVARERLDRYMLSRRLYRELPDGEREYLSDAEIDEARAGAAADVEQWCD